jgi:hypothetical protein
MSNAIARTLQILEDLRQYQQRRRNRAIREDIFLKKDTSANTIVVFSDKPEKQDRTKETISLAKEFRRLGLDWKPELGHWVGGSELLPKVNALIKQHNKLRDVVESLEQLEEFVQEADIEPSKKSELMARLDGFVDELSDATDQAKMDEAIRRYLEFFSRFHNYSLYNTLMIWVQKRDATKVAGMRKWREKNRGIKKGAKAIFIWVPVSSPKRGETDEGSPDEVDTTATQAPRRFTSRFILGKVFDISDTYALTAAGDIPDTPQWFSDNQPSEIADELVTRLEEFASTLGITLSREQSTRGEQGFSRGEHINLSSDVRGVGAASVLVHELAHELLHWKKSSPFYTDDPEMSSREIKELQAESVSYVVLRHYGLPVQHHPTYLALWKANKEKIKANLNIITKCANYIISGIDKER